ncbi:tetratricopeptide repeat protein [Asticcacaulis sp. BYS171W]|uniref:Tetratricopeptide repeat protein n=1 Tax=Asticcacaulis aquaticus TaxID=2984212 RepID=A0ABT5HSZ1_9CAUL|nr:tetratricopeptide repeat protein [Asticcacaulis aquaticus]MDC7683192.1 tetratricopeptide repeat protein [Asticcacaulis aquaticus]
MAQSVVYDGTGSSSGKVMDAEVYAKYQSDIQTRQAEIDKERAKADRLSGSGLFDLGSRLNQGYVDGRPDLKTAYDLYEAAAEKGEVRALSVMCTAYLLGLNRPVNAARAMTYCNKLDVKHPTLIFSVGYDYEYGLSGPKDETAALNEYAAAAQAGSGEAMNRIGLKILAQTDKASQARQWFRNAVRAGSVDAMVNLAKMTEAGQGGFKDPKEAVWLYTNAARLGHKGATDWLTQTQPVDPLHRNQLLAADGWLITQTFTDKNGKREQKFNFNIYESHFVKMAEKNDSEKTATLHCYITAEHVVDVCLTITERPIGHGLAPLLQQILTRPTTVASQDANDDPTAHSVFIFRYSLEAY